MRRVLLVFCALLLGGCAGRFPLDIPEEQWLSMSPEQQLEARQEQARLDRAREQRRRAEARAREAESRKRAAEIESQRAAAAYGERVQCVLNNVQMDLGGKLRAAEPLALDLVRGMRIEVPVAASSESGWMSYERTLIAGFDGQTIMLCESEQDFSPPYARCARILGTRAQYHRGLDTRIASDFLQAKARCDLVPDVRGLRSR